MEDNKEFLDEELVSPLIVHKETDVSYQAVVSDGMNDTHIESDEPTLKRHRFRKENQKGKSKGIVFVLVLIVVAVAVFCALYFTGNITFDKQQTTTKTTTTTEAVTSIEEAFKGTIVIKGTFVFVDGVEVDGSRGLQSALEYEDVSTTAYTIIDEDADSNFLNYEVLPLLTNMGFYDENTVITRRGYTGLVAKAEQETTIAQ